MGSEQKKFHGYNLIKHCGSGAYGDVYFCKDISGKELAMKIISKKKFGDSWKKELDGVRNYRKITEEKSGLLQIFHADEDEESFFYTMEAADSAGETEYIPDTLSSRLKSGALPEKELQPILFAVFDSIKFLHSAGFAHRDIKPDNILFVNGCPKLADIGLVSSLENSRTMLAGTPDFIPREEWNTDSRSSGKLSRQRNDLYAFGKVIYCAVTGLQAHEFPSYPEGLPLSLPRKYFIQLANALCKPKACLRLNSIQQLEKELSEIGDILNRGETFRDKVRYFIKQNFWKILLTVIIIALFAFAGVAACIGYKCQKCGQMKFANVVCKQCIEKIKSMPLDQSLEMMEFEKNSRIKDKLAPYVLYNIAEDWAVRLNKPTYGRKKYFDDLYEQCQQIRRVKCPGIENSNIMRFAGKYIDYYDSNITVEITGMTGKVAEAARGEIILKEYCLGVVDMPEKKTDLKDIGYEPADKNEFSIKLTESLTIDPWEKPYIWLRWQHGYTQKEQRISFNPQGKYHRDEAVDRFDFAQYISGFDYLFANFKIAAGHVLPDLYFDVFKNEKPDIKAILGD